MQARVKPLLTAPGSVQMSVDLEMLEEAYRDRTVIVRAGLWRPPAASIGRRQEARGPLDPRRLEALGLELARRPTGGLTIVHEASSFTLHAAIPAGHPLAEEPVDRAAYTLGEAIVEALAGMGVEAWARATPWRVRLTPYPTSICLAYTSPSDLVVGDGRRFAGIALRKGRLGLLAQAFIMVGRPNYELWAAVDGYPSPSHLERVMAGIAPPPGVGVEKLAAETAERVARLL